MRGKFYTEVDIVDLARGGTRRLQIHEGDRITDVARERARKEGVELVWDDPAAEAPPHRYPPMGGKSAPARAGGSWGVDTADLRQRVRASVLAKLGSGVEPAVVEDIIGRVFRQLGLR